MYASGGIITLSEMYASGGIITLSEFSGAAPLSLAAQRGADGGGYGA